MSEELFKDWMSPNGKVAAIVEREGDGIFFYLQGPKESNFGVKSCWVRNLAPAPDELDVAGMREGRAPLLPADCCAHKQGAKEPNPDDLDVIWFEECDAAALLEKKDVLAIIPGWSGYKDFHGYARDCIKESDICWPLQKDNVLHERVSNARKFWRSWDEGRWQSYREELWSPLKKAFGEQESYYPIDGDTWPPRALLQFRMGDTVVLATVGVSILPQPSVDQFTDEPESIRRVEFGWAMSTSWFEKFGEDAKRYIRANAGLPWDQFTWMGDGHTIGFEGPTGTNFGALLLSANPPEAPEILLPKPDGDPIRILWMIPITKSERKIAQTLKSKELWKKLKQDGRTWITK